jgi:DNA-binding FrmR family transcriptional regulator
MADWGWGRPDAFLRRVLDAFLAKSTPSFYTAAVQVAGVSCVSHTAREKVKLLNRVRRIRGQIEAVERALEQEIGCSDVLQLIAGARGAVNGLMAEVMEDHIRMHVVASAECTESEQTQAAEELIEVVRSYFR